MKIKLKDLTEEQYKKWFRDSKCNTNSCESCPLDLIQCHPDTYNCWQKNKDIFSDKFLNQEIEIEDEPILDKQEKEYLENVLRPFKDRVSYIWKKTDFSDEKIKIDIKYYDSSKTVVIYEIFNLPPFKANTMYKCMESNKKYTLKELGLFDNEK